MKIVDSNLIKNCPVTRSDIVAAEVMFGLNVESLKENTTKKITNQIKENYSKHPPSKTNAYGQYNVLSKKKS